MRGRQEFAFSTGGPVILSSQPGEGDVAIHEDQAFILVLDAEATEASLLAHVGFAVEGLPQRVGFRVVAGPEREAERLARYLAEPKPVVFGPAWRGEGDDLARAYRELLRWRTTQYEALAHETVIGFTG